jgi:hypothetical protein
MTVSRKRLAAMIAVLVLPPLVTLAYAWRVFSHYHIDEPERLSPEARADVVAVIRASLESQPAVEPTHPELGRSLANDGPVVVTVWLDGRQAIRADGFGKTVAVAVAEAARVLPTHPGMEVFRRDPGAARRARIKIDVVVGRGPLAEGAFRAVSLNPGVEGLGVRLDGERDVTLLPYDLVQFDLLSVKRPIQFIKDLKIGLDFDRADSMLARFAQLPPGGYGEASRSYFRFRTDTFVEKPEGSRDQPPLPLTRGLPPGPELTAENLRHAALEGGRYLVRHLAPNGRYQYEVSMINGKGTDPNVPGPYSIPRHAGTTYFLAELYRHTGEEFLREPIERAFGHLAELVELGGCTGTLPSGKEYACVVDKGQKRASLGSAALGLVALCEYRRATGDPRYDELMHKLGEWILYMQRDDGSFRHLYDVPSQTPDDKTMLLYFSGEATLALARMYEIFQDERYRVAVEKGLDWQVAWYDFFAGGFFFGEEHWACISSEAAWPGVKHERYRDFCQNYGAFLRRQQPVEGENPGAEDLVGSYTFTPFVVPNNTPAGSRSEAMISAYLLTKHHGQADADIRGQVLRSMKYVLRQQIREDNAWAVPPEAQGIGALTASGLNRTVRIDYVQHVCSAMIRSIELLEDELAER